MVKKATQTEPEVQTEAPTTETAAPAVEAPKVTKSIVPARYAGKYKKGGIDALAEFINAQCSEKGVFDFAKFWDLCKKNGLAAEKVDHYAGQVAEKRHGAQGRARMTLRNMLATIVRKDSKLKALDGSEVPLTLPKLPVVGAAASAAKTEPATEQAGAVTSQFSPPKLSWDRQGRSRVESRTPRNFLEEVMDIGEAVKEMHNGERVARTGWNGKDMYLQLQVPDKNSKMTLPYVYMKTVQGDLVPWLCSQTDLLASDWFVVA